MTSETVEAVAVALGRFAMSRRPVRHGLLGVSGGPDSLALLLAMAERRGGVAVSVATVDHGLRPEGAGEAAFVAALCRDLGLAHRTLVWRSPGLPRGNLMAAAREARYDLLSEEAARIGADALMVAHHADDQIETHLLARARGAGGSALAGMRPWRDLQPGLVLLRPFLALPKRALEETVRRAGVEAVADPSNADTRFRRARLRAELADGAHDLAAIRRAIGDASALREAEDAHHASAIGRAADERRIGVDACGAADFRPGAGDAALWSRILTAVGGGLHPPPRAAADRLAARFEAGEGKAATLAGCRIEAGRGGLVARREFGRAGPPGVAVAPGALAFDRRFTIASIPPGRAERIEALGRLGLGGAAQRTLPVALDRDGSLVGVHPALQDRFAGVAVLAVRQRVGWRIWADLPGEPPERLTAEPQNAANPSKAVGKDLAATYLRGRVKVRAP
ncbi:tRNA lysidine(34) synthetase TilS [Aureimonas flava]|uniref:tRNA(Ile)-lysidine synthase n=1 Tax=Aureimonas flava TaxID=2320271 RepID=A0A3A1WHR4_9HYPH|nr:tRNA lysidine(34) synthetase TilS [Aureimonas flava]RIX98742.1 tRNA lysidine(34) synthetase TilS [Aureimonas flava]